MMNDNNFIWLQNWYEKHCNGDWEHQKNICINTIDNPGWSISINLVDTELEDKFFPVNEVNNSETDWWICFVENNVFEGRCGALNLPEILKVFRNWAEN